LKCLLHGKKQWEECTEEMVCKSKGSKFYIDWSEEDSVHNLITRLNLICESKFNIGLIGSCFFIGVFISVTLVSPISDIVGRRNFVYTGALI
jgi:MFS family permease